MSLHALSGLFTSCERHSGHHHITVGLDVAQIEEVINVYCLKDFCPLVSQVHVEEERLTLSHICRVLRTADK